MTWTYVDPNNNARDKVRFLIGDTDTTDQLVSDEEIAYLLSETGNSVYLAAHDACYAISSKFARMATSKSVGDLSLSFANRAEQFAALAERLVELAARREPPAPWVAAESIAAPGSRTTTPTTSFSVGGLDYRR